MAAEQEEDGQLELLPGSLPEGFAYREDLVPPSEARDLVERLGRIDLEPFSFQGYLGKRRVASFGLHYDFETATLREAKPIPDFLLDVRELAANFAELDAFELPHALVTEYSPGAGIGWHRDRAVFGDVVGLSFVSSCRFRLRRKAGTKWERVSLALLPRSAYLLRGEARTVWEHSIPPAEALRYSITFRTLRNARKPG